MALLLPALGYAPAIAHSLKGATALLDERHYHVLLCDPDLPDGDGLDLLRHANRSFPTCGVVLTTTVGNAAEFRSLTQGFSAHLVNHVSATQLEDAIATAVDRWTRAV